MKAELDMLEDQNNIIKAYVESLLSSDNARRAKNQEVKIAIEEEAARDMEDLTQLEAPATSYSGKELATVSAVSATCVEAAYVGGLPCEKAYAGAAPHASGRDMPPKRVEEMPEIEGAMRTATVRR